MTSRTRPTLFVTLALSLVLLLWASPAQAACPEADDARTNGELSRAEELARQCVRRAPDDASSWMSLSRALGSQGRYDEALRWTERTIERHPDDPYPRLWKARLHYFAGRHDDAAETIATLPMATRGEPEVVLLRADLALARDQNSRASQLYERYLQTTPDDPNALYHRGLAYREQQRVDEARADLQRACEIGAGSTAACGALVDLERRDGPSGYAIILPGYFWVPDGVDGYTLAGAIGYSPNQALTLELNGEYRARGFGDRGLATGDGERLEDLILGAEARMKFGERWSLDVGGSFSPDAEFVPEWTAHLEPGVSFGLGEALDLQLRTRFWRIQFAPAGANVIEPILIAGWDRFALDLRYYLSIEDEGLRSDGGDALGHSGLARLYYYLGDVTHLFAGVGAGDRTDYLDLRLPDSEGYTLATAGLRWEVVTSHSLIAEWVYRDEQAGELDYAYHEFILGYRKDVF